MGELNSLRENIEGWQNEAAPGPWDWVLALVSAAENLESELRAARKVLGMSEDWPGSLDQAADRLGEVLWPEDLDAMLASFHSRPSDRKGAGE